MANIQPWGYRFGCSPCLKDKLASQSINLTNEIVEQECIACGLHVPQTGPSPRHCLHNSLVIDECLTKEMLEEETGLRWEAEMYKDIVTQCQTGPVRPLVPNFCIQPPFYRNQYCAICNTWKTADLRCASPYDNPDDTWDFCLTDAELCDLSEGEESSSDRSPEPDTTGGNTTGNDSRMRRAVPMDHDPQTSGNGMTTATDDTTRPIPESHDISGRGEISTEPKTMPTFPVIICGITRSYTSFSLFLDVRGDSGVITSEITASTITTICSKGQVFDPINQACR